MRLATVTSVCRQVLITILKARVCLWVFAAPIVWILRDGLGPGMTETSGVWSVVKFLVQWGVPALMLGVPMLILSIFERRRVNANDSASLGHAKPDSPSKIDGGLRDESAAR